MSDTTSPAQGWQLVPADPTPSMLKAAVISLNGNAVYKSVATEALRIEEQMYAEVYSAMLAAAPQPAQAEPVDPEIGLRDKAARVLMAWDSTVLPRANDGMLQECMESLRAALGLKPEVE